MEQHVYEVLGDIDTDVLLKNLKNTNHSAIQSYGGNLPKQFRVSARFMPVRVDDKMRAGAFVDLQLEPLKA
jgi:hypothetical protein